MRFPRRFPVLLFLLGFLFVLPVLLGLLASLWFALALSPLQKQYLAPYGAAELAGNVTRGAGRSLPFIRVVKTAPGRKPELAGEVDVVEAENPEQPNLPLRLSTEARAEGWAGFASVNTTERPALYAAALREQFFDGRSLVRLIGEPAIGGAGLLAILFLAAGVFRGRFGRQSVTEERHGRRTKGPELVSARAWSQGWLRGRKDDGIRLRLKGKWGLPGASFCIRRKLEASHILLMGDTGSGKSNAIRQILRQVEERGEAAVVYDPAGEFAREFYRPERGDLLLNPLDERCPC